MSVLGTIKGYIASVLPASGSALRNAVDEGDLSEVQRLLALDVKMDVKDKNGNTPLHRAAGAGHLEIVLALLGKGAAVDAENADGTTPLMTATLAYMDGSGDRDDLDVIVCLLARGANIGKADKRGSTPLIWAVYEGKAELVDLYLAEMQEKLPLDRALEIIDQKDNMGLAAADYAEVKMRADIAARLDKAKAEIIERQEKYRQLREKRLPKIDTARRVRDSIEDGAKHEPSSFDRVSEMKL